MSGAQRVLGLVVEGRSDARTVPGLTDRVLAEKLPTAAKKLGQLRAYRGLDERAPFLAWSAVWNQKDKVPRAHGHFGGKPIEDARSAHLALQCFVAQDPQPAAVILVRDSDGKQEDRLRGLEQARKDRTWPFPVVLGVAHTMLECWILSGFSPETKQEAALLAALKKELGFDPTVRSERLDASNEAAKKSPKRVLKRLTEGNRDREARCWTNADLEELRERCAKNGLETFLREIEDRLLPVFAERAD